MLLLLLASGDVGCRRHRGSPIGKAPETRRDVGGQPSCGSLCGQLDCCESTVVPSGSFTFGRDESGNDRCPAGLGCGVTEVPAAKVTVASFRLDRFEVTVGRFRRFVEDYDAWRGAGHPIAGAGNAPGIAGSGWSAQFSAFLPKDRVSLERGVSCSDHTWTIDRGSNEQRPINCVSWFEAQAFCIWDGGRLPLDVEWEYAAAGGEEERLFPWGADMPVDCSWANWDGEGCSALPEAVGSKSKNVGRWGQFDLAGNVAEWVFARGSVGAIAPGLDSLLRGGAVSTDRSLLRAASRLGDGPTGEVHKPWWGARCARTA